MKVRIGIDVGGTFTDAVAINNDTYELIGTVKVPTTHTVKEGVAAGIVEVLHKVMEENGIRPEDVTFIAHGTTQATNALLEGDVANVGIVTMGSGLQGAKADPTRRWAALSWRQASSCPAKTSMWIPARHRTLRPQ